MIARVYGVPIACVSLLTYKYLLLFFFVLPRLPLGGLSYIDLLLLHHRGLLLIIILCCNWLIYSLASCLEEAVTKAHKPFAQQFTMYGVLCTV